MAYVLIEEIIRRNEEQANLFSSETQKRRQWFAEHPTALGALKCMDGRINLALLTNTPFGIFRPWRNIGGDFRVGWPVFATSLREWIKDSESEGRESILFVSYHWSVGEKHRGCRGFDYDLGKSKKRILDLKQKISEVFRHHRLWPLLIGIETDSNAILVHGDDTEVLDMREIKNKSEISLRIRRMFPRMSSMMTLDLVVLLEGNFDYIAKTAAENRPAEDLVHRERILAIGQGFDWIHQYNQAIIIGPFDLNLTDPIEVGANLILKNFQEGRIKEKGVLLTCAPYQNRWLDYQSLAAEKSRELADFAFRIFQKRLPTAVDFFVPLVGIVDIGTRRFTPLPYDFPKN